MRLPAERWVDAAVIAIAIAGVVTGFLVALGAIGG